MITSISIGAELAHIQNIVNEIGTKRAEKKFTVIDIGGGNYSWSWPVVDAIMDRHDPNCKLIPQRNPYSQFNIKFFKGDMTRESGWKEINEYVKANGKFDFSICRHTLEDLPNPFFVCDKLEQVSNGGFIAVPTKESELRTHYHESFTNIKGMGHHHWVFLSYKGKSIIALPKMSWIEAFTNQDLYNVNTRLGGSGGAPTPKQELSFTWEGTTGIEFAIAGAKQLPEEYFRDNPNIAEVFKQYDHPWDAFKYFLNNSD